MVIVSQRALEAVIGRAILDKEFRLALFADPEAALVEYELTERELAAIKSVDAESLDACAGGLGQRTLTRLTTADGNATAHGGSGSPCEPVGLCHHVR